MNDHRLFIGTGRAINPEFLQQQCVRTLYYPEGATIEDGGELAVIPSAHLYRIPFKWSTERTDDDASMQADWLQGKKHAITGEPLEIFRLTYGTASDYLHRLYSLKA